MDVHWVATGDFFFSDETCFMLNLQIDVVIYSVKVWKQTSFNNFRNVPNWNRGQYSLGNVFQVFSENINHSGRHDGSTKLRIYLCASYPPLLENDGMFQQDNASCHTTRSARAWLHMHQNAFTVVPWLANSPDLNAIEKLWDPLDRVVRAMILNRVTLHS